MKLYYSDTFELPLPENHRFPMAKYTALRRRIANNLAGTFDLELPPAARDDQLLLVHSLAYLNAVKSGQLTDLEIRRIGFPWSEKMVERSRRSTGASIAAARAASTEGISANLAGGTHHAFADRGQGYCVFNDVCVAARVIQAENLGRQVLIVDCDVHQGNGTAAITKSDPTIFSFSMHCEKNFPFQKTNGDLDVALPPGTGDEEYLSRLERSLDSIHDQFLPDLAFFIAGADPFSGDRLGLLNLTKNGLARRDELVITYFRERNIPLAISMGGGYAPDLNDIVDIHFSTIQFAARRWANELTAS